MGMGLWVAGSSPLTVGGNCVNIVKAKTKKTTTTAMSLMTTTIRMREQEKGSAESCPLEVVMRSGHSCFTLRLCSCLCAVE